MATHDLFAGVLPFFHVAEEKSFRRAAVRLGVTPAAISKSVLRLEEELGVKLLARTSRSVVVTPEGTTFLARCRDAIASVTAGRELVSERGRQPHGEVTLTVPPVLSRLLVAGLPRLASRYPKLTTRFVVTDRVANLSDEGIDVAVRMGPLPESSLVARRLRGSRWVTLAAPSYVASHGLPASPRDLERFECIRFVAPDGRARDWTFAEPKGGTSTIKVDGRVLVDQGERLIDAAVAGLGVCQVLDLMVGPHVRDGRLVPLLASFAAEGPAITALARPERSRSPNVRAVFAYLAETFRDPEALG